MQKVTILNSGTVGAVVSGELGFGPWQVVPDVQGRLPSLIRLNATSVIIGAHEIKLRRLAFHHTERTGAAEYRQKIGPVSPDRVERAVVVTICFEIKDSVETSAGEAVLQCR